MHMTMMTNQETQSHVVIAGGSGFLGRGLARELRQRGSSVTILSRSDSRPSDWPDDLTEGVDWLKWDARTLGEWASCLEGVTAMVNLVGRTVDCRKTPENKKVILESRVDSCRVLGEALRTVTAPPPVWIQSATAHIVGDPEPRETICDESTPPGPMHEMAPFVGVEWEKAFNAAKLPEQRGVILRISFVLGPHGGPFARLANLTRIGLGGTVGPGTQWMSWIHQHDLSQLMIAAIDDESFEGVYMVTAPEPVTNRDFMRDMRRAAGRPWSPPAPSIGVRLACRFLLNTDPELALLGRRCVPTRLQSEHGFAFQYPTIDVALQDLWNR
jgi:uncharacterized protein (TIGR01777 family)